MRSCSRRRTAARSGTRTSTAAYKPAVTRADLDPRTRFHDLRHTAAAMMIGQGAYLLVVKERLGHSSISVTADRYGHLYPSLSAALTTQLESVYQDAAGRRLDNGV
ncbi:MAG: tyrosine-type recombinase/integrase [Acidimicrobiales bacterium]